MGHSVTIATKHPQYGSFNWNGVDVVEGLNIDLMAEFTKRFDYIITLWDIWRIAAASFPREKWVAYVPISSESVGQDLEQTLSGTSTQIAMSRHGEKAMNEVGISPIYAPHGIDTSVFTIKPDGRANFRA